jgi:ribosomal protein S18 acetylase RimI-like enzyme
MDYVEGYKPGLLAGLIRLHVDYYGAEWGFGAGYESLVAKDAAAFLDRYDERRDLILTVWRGPVLRGSIVIDGSKPLRAHLRWFAVDRRLQGKGVGAELMSRAMAFVDERSPSNTFLTSFVGLDAAAALYRKHGFEIVSEPAAERAAGEVLEQMWERPRLRPNRG